MEEEGGLRRGLEAGGKGLQREGKRDERCEETVKEREREGCLGEAGGGGERQNDSCGGKTDRVWEKRKSSGRRNGIGSEEGRIAPTKNDQSSFNSWTVSELERSISNLRGCSSVPHERTASSCR
ncbi:hypothetical protein KM043_008562 [Ampulex compressa]|nr:hypothetical protein KM043_008562 [Ampulex compressa]